MEIPFTKNKKALQRFAPKQLTPRKKRVSEWKLQAKIIAKFHFLEANGWPFTCAGDQNAARRSKMAAGIAKVTGMTAGEPDIRVYLPKGRLGLCELKAEGGTASDEQRARHKRLAELGHQVTIIKAKTEDEAERLAVAWLKKLLGKT